MDVRQKVLETFSEIASCNIPWLERDLTKESCNSGPWRLMESPLLFLMRNECLLDEKGVPFRYELVFGCVNEGAQAGGGYESFEDSSLVPLAECPYLDKVNALDKRRLRFVLEAQLGSRTTDLFAEAERWRYGLFAALTLHAFSDETKKDAQELFDVMNRSMGGSGPFDPVNIDIGRWGDLYWEIVGKFHKVAREYFPEERTPTFSNVLFSRLLTAARLRGVISTSAFGWIKAFDRILWYTLSQTGRNVAASEAAGVMSHIIVEDIMGKTYDVPMIDPAIEGFDNEMIRQCWLPSRLAG